MTTSPPTGLPLLLTAPRFTIKEVIGRGSYGVVCSAVDNQTGEMVAIKKITNVFEHVSDATRILREIKLLRLLKHPDIVEIKHIMLPPSSRDFADIYVVFELMETDLHQVGWHETARGKSAGGCRLALPLCSGRQLRVPRLQTTCPARLWPDRRWELPTNYQAIGPHAPMLVLYLYASRGEGTRPTHAAVPAVARRRLRAVTPSLRACSPPCRLPAFCS